MKQQSRENQHTTDTQNNFKSRRLTVEKWITFDSVSKNYGVVFYYGNDKKGKGIKSSQTFKTLKEARKARDCFYDKKNYEKRNFTVFVPRKICLSDYLNEFIEYHQDEKEVTTVRHWKSIQKRTESHVIGGEYICNLTPVDVEGYIRFLRKEGLKPQTIRGHVAFIGATLKKAVKNGYIIKNPVDGIDMPKMKPEDKKTWNSSKLQKYKTLCSAVKENPDKVTQTIFYLGMVLGLRRGEMLGLKWENVDLKTGAVRIVNNRVPLESEMIDKNPKTYTSRRLLCAGEHLLTFLVGLKKWQEKYIGKGCEYVITNPRTKKPPTAMAVYTSFKKFLKENGAEEWTIHDLRHAYGTLAYKGGEDILSVSHSMGHSSTTVTIRYYTHLDETESAACSATVAKAVF